jgi:hypothetical protein
MGSRVLEYTRIFENGPATAIKRYVSLYVCMLKFLQRTHAQQAYISLPR